MDKYKLSFTRLQAKILRFLSIKVGTKVNQRNIAKALNVSPTAVAKALKKLDKSRLIKIKKDPLMNLNLVELERENKKSIELKRTENLKMIQESGVVDFLEEKFPGTVIILFGSYSYGEDTVKSDIDLSVVGAKEKALNLEKYEKFLEREINVNVYSSFKEISKDLKDNLMNGIVLVGRVSL